MTAALYVQVDGPDGGVHHKVKDVLESRSNPDQRGVDTACGQSFKLDYHRIHESSTEPGGVRCPKCFGKGK